MQNVIEITDLQKRYTEFALDKLTLSFPKGYITGIIGPNGAGKTTMIKLILNLTTRDGGDIRLLGLDPLKNEREIKNRVGYVGEEPYFYDNKPAAWTGRLASNFFSEWDEVLYRRLLSEFQIDPRMKIKHYSKGMRVQLSLAVALSHRPEIVILDEPTSGLDPFVRRNVLSFLKDFTADGDKSVIISSHITDDLARIADYIAYLIQGRLALFGQKDEILNEWKKIHFAPTALDAAISETLRNGENHVFDKSGLTAQYSRIKKTLAPGIARGEIKVESIGLDDILISLARESKYTTSSFSSNEHPNGSPGKSNPREDFS